jgi:hypothetical protein
MGGVLDDHLRGCLDGLMRGVAERAIVIAVPGRVRMHKLGRANGDQQRHAKQGKQRITPQAAGTHWSENTHQLKL